MVAQRSRVRIVARRSPLAGHHEGRLVMFLDPAITSFARIVRRVRLTLFPAQTLEAEPLAVIAMRASHEVAPLVAGLELALDPRHAMDRRCRGEKNLRAPGEGARASLRECDGVAFLVGGRRIGVDLVEKQVARRRQACAVCVNLTAWSAGRLRCWRR